MKLYIDSSYTKIKFKDTEADLQKKIETILTDELSVLPKDYQYSWAFKHGGDPSINFYNAKTQEFPTGLVKKVKQILMSHGYSIESFDKRPDLFVDGNDIPSDIKLQDTNSEITLRPYQRRAVFNGLEKGYGIMNFATAAGKCVTSDTELLTENGYETIEDIFKDQGILLDGYAKAILPNKPLKLVNRYGKLEEIGQFTRNGEREVVNIMLESGKHEEITLNHPLLVSRNTGQTWVQAKDIEVGDLVVTYKGISARDLPQYAYEKVINKVPAGHKFTYDVSMPETHSFVANGIINHNTEIAAGLIKQLLPELQKDERIVFFTGSTEIYKQTIDRLSTRLGISVGYWGGSKRKLSKVMVVMLPTVSSALAIDPMAKLKISGKKSELKKIALNYAPQFVDNPNALSAFKSFIRFFSPKSKIEQRIKQSLEDDLYSCGSDKDVQDLFKRYSSQWLDVLKDKAGDKLKKQQFVHKFLDSIVAYFADECHHTKSDTWYTSLLQCNNARYHIGLSATVDQRDPVLWMRLQAIFGEIIAKKNAESLIKEGILAKPTIYTINNTQGFNIPDEVAQKGAKLNWMDTYRYGIVQNEHRNKMIAYLTKRAYAGNNIILIIVNYAEQGEILSKYLDDEQVPNKFLNGTQDIKYRKEYIQQVRDGKLRVVIATSIFDEGLDVSGFNVLVLAGAGKSFRQVVQRIGRALRKKEGDNTAKIFDFYDRNNDYLQKHSKERQEVYGIEKFPVVFVKELITN